MLLGSNMVLWRVLLQTAIQVMAPCAGVIEELLVPDGEKVIAGQDLFRLKTGGAPAAKPAAAEAAAPVAAAAEPPSPSPPAAAAPSPPAASPDISGPIPSSPPPVPPLPTGPMSSKPASEVPVTPYQPGAAAGVEARKETRVRHSITRYHIILVYMHPYLNFTGIAILW